MKRVISSMFSDKKFTKKESKRRQFPRVPEDYTLLEECGSGATGSVWRAQCVPLHAEVAVKKVNLETVQAEVETFVAEAQTMSLLHHPNLLPLYCSFMCKESLWMVMPFVSGGSLQQILKEKHPNGLSEAACCTILYETLKGLDYLHKHNVIHRDIKAGNILMGQDGTVWLADFGIAASTQRTSSWGKTGAVRTTFAGSICWMAPEVMCSEDYDWHADIWSLGITALELANGLPPHAKTAPMKVLMTVMRDDPPTLEDNPELGKSFSKLFKDLIAKCLQKDATSRPSAEQLLSHKFFKAVLSKEQLRGELLTACPDSPQPQVLVQQDAVLEDAALAAEAEQVAANNVSMWNFNLTCLKKELPDQGSSSPRESESMPDEDGSPCSAFTNIEARPGPVPGSGSIRRIKSSLSETSMASSSDILSAQLSQNGGVETGSEPSAPDWNLPEGMAPLAPLAPLAPSPSMPHIKSSSSLRPARSLGRSHSDLRVTPAVDRRRGGLATPGGDPARAAALQQAAQRRGRFVVVEEGAAPPRPPTGSTAAAYNRSKSGLGGAPSGSKSSGRLNDDYHESVAKESHRLQAAMASRKADSQQGKGKRVAVHNILSRT